MLFLLKWTVILSVKNNEKSSYDIIDNSSKMHFEVSSDKWPEQVHRSLSLCKFVKVAVI